MRRARPVYLLSAPTRLITGIVLMLFGIAGLLLLVLYLAGGGWRDGAENRDPIELSRAAADTARRQTDLGERWV
jgi:hypothetical protein